MKLLLDTNVLLLLIVGLHRPAAIGGKRLTEFDQLDFDLVLGVAKAHPVHISTPHILAEVSNFVGSGNQQLVPGGAAALARYIHGLEEIIRPALDIVLMPEYEALGLTDTGVLLMADKQVKVVTVDFHLCNRLVGRGIDAINLRHLRQQ